MSSTIKRRRLSGPASSGHFPTLESFFKRRLPYPLLLEHSTANIRPFPMVAEDPWDIVALDLPVWTLEDGWVVDGLNISWYPILAGCDVDEADPQLRAEQPAKALAPAHSTNATVHPYTAGSATPLLAGRNPAGCALLLFRQAVGLLV